MTATPMEMQLEIEALKRAREDELRNPVSTRDRRVWFERTGRRIAELRKQLEEHDDQHRD